MYVKPQIHKPLWKSYNPTKSFCSYKEYAVLSLTSVKFKFDPLQNLSENAGNPIFGKNKYLGIVNKVIKVLT